MPTHKSKLTAGERTGLGITHDSATAVPNPDGPGELIGNFYPMSIVELCNGSWQSPVFSAIPRDEGKTWTNFKNIAAIRCLADRSFIPPGPVMTPICGDDEVGKLPDDYQLWHYSRITVTGNEGASGLVTREVRDRKGRKRQRGGGAAGGCAHMDHPR